MRCFTIHSVRKGLLELNLSDYILTFDDALFSQYFYWSYFKKFKTKKILFIPTGAIRLTDKRRPMFKEEHCDFPDCYHAMDNWKKQNNLKDYMTLGEIMYLIENDKSIIIGGHSHNHIRPYEYGQGLFEMTSNMKRDADIMIEWFNTYLSIKPMDYCYPFNEEHEMLTLILKDRGIKEFYGSERIDIDL